MSSTNAKDLIFAKICSMIILSATSVIAGLIPIKLGALLYKNSNKNKKMVFEKIMSFFLYFGAGVLLCTIFLHMMPDIHDEMKRIAKSIKLLPNLHLKTDFFPNLMICFGFFLIYSIEEIMHTKLVADSGPISAKENHFELHTECGATTAPATKSPDSTDKCLGYKIVENGDLPHNGCSEHEHIKAGLCDHKNYHSCGNHHCTTMEGQLQGHHIVNQEDIQHSHKHEREHIPDFSNSISSGLLIVMALSFHEIFEGMAVGLENETAEVWCMLAAISCHKIVLSAFIGLQLLASRSTVLVSCIFITIYAITTSIGIFIGLLVALYSHENDSMKLTSVSLQGMATGTLLYVVFFEIFLKTESTHKLSGTLKAVSSICGFVFMTFLQVLLSENS